MTLILIALIILVAILINKYDVEECEKSQMGYNCRGDCGDEIHN